MAPVVHGNINGKLPGLKKLESQSIFDPSGPPDWFTGTVSSNTLSNDALTAATTIDPDAPQIEVG